MLARRASAIEEDRETETVRPRLALVEYQSSALPKLYAAAFGPFLANSDSIVIVLGLELMHLLDVARAIKEIETILYAAR